MDDIPGECMRTVGGGKPSDSTAFVSPVDMARPKSVAGNRAANWVLPRAWAATTSRRTCWSGVMPRVHTPGRDCDVSLVKASTGMLEPWAIGATDAVSADVSGPRIRLSPLLIAA